MKKQFFLLATAAMLGFAACNDSGTTGTSSTDSTTTMQTTTEKKGMQIANFDTRTFMDLKTNKPVKLHWDTERFYYVDDAGNQPYYYYDPSSKDTFDYWGRRLNSYMIYSNGDYMIDESRMPSMEMNMDQSSMDTSSSNPSTATDTKIKAKDDKYKEKTDSTKLKVTNNKIKIKDR